MSHDLALQEGSGDASSYICFDSLLVYLSWIENCLIACELAQLFPPEKIKRWIYSPLSLLKLAILQDKKRIRYRTLVSTLTAEECIAILPRSV
jgi:predicted branched-subunit amino acid permease